MIALRPRLPSRQLGTILSPSRRAAGGRSRESANRERCAVYPEFSDVLIAISIAAYLATSLQARHTFNYSHTPRAHEPESAFSQRRLPRAHKPKSIESTHVTSLHTRERSDFWRAHRQVNVLSDARCIAQLALSAHNYMRTRADKRTSTYRIRTNAQSHERTSTRAHEHTITQFQTYRTYLKVLTL